MDKAKELEPNPVDQASLCLEVYALLVAGTCAAFAKAAPGVALLGIEAVYRITKYVQTSWVFRSASDELAKRADESARSSSSISSHS